MTASPWGHFINKIGCSVPTAALLLSQASYAPARQFSFRFSALAARATKQNHLDAMMLASLPAETVTSTGDRRAVRWDLCRLRMTTGSGMHLPLGFKCLAQNLIQMML
jgi:hypothetical protein